MHLVMPTRSLDYLLMGIIAGIIAGIILVYVLGVTFEAIAKVAETLRNAFKTW